MAFRFLMGNAQLVKKSDALPGRATSIASTFTAKEMLHYVTKKPIAPPFAGKFDGADTAQRCVFANGCFWGSEKNLWRMPGVHITAVGYINGYTVNPTYEEVCSGKTGHTEAVLCVWDPAKVSFTDLLRMFWESHDPTQGMGQGNDRGTQYRSGIYCADKELFQVAQESKAAYQDALKSAGISAEITTEVCEVTKILTSL